MTILSIDILLEISKYLTIGEYISLRLTSTYTYRNLDSISNLYDIDDKYKGKLTYQAPQVNRNIRHLDLSLSRDVVTDIPCPNLIRLKGQLTRGRGLVRYDISKLHNLVYIENVIPNCLYGKDTRVCIAVYKHKRGFEVDEIVSPEQEDEQDVFDELSGGISVRSISPYILILNGFDHPHYHIDTHLVQMYVILGIGSPYSYIMSNPYIVILYTSNDISDTIECLDKAPLLSNLKCLYYANDDVHNCCDEHVDDIVNAFIEKGATNIDEIYITLYDSEFDLRTRYSDGSDDNSDNDSVNDSDSNNDSDDNDYISSWNHTVPSFVKYMKVTILDRDFNVLRVIEKRNDTSYVKSNICNMGGVNFSDNMSNMTISDMSSLLRHFKAPLSNTLSSFFAEFE